MVQIVEQTYTEKLQMYMKLSKRQLAEMLIESNRQLSLFTDVVTVYDSDEFRCDPQAVNVISDGSISSNNGQY